MGYQESFVSFATKTGLIAQLKKYMERDHSDDLAEIVCVDRVKKPVFPFSVGDLLLVVCGERSEQRFPSDLRRLGIDQVQQVVFIDCEHYMNMANKQFHGDLGAFLEDRFEKIPLEDVLKEDFR